MRVEGFSRNGLPTTDVGSAWFVGTNKILKKIKKASAVTVFRQQTLAPRGFVGTNSQNVIQILPSPLYRLKSHTGNLCVKYTRALNFENLSFLQTNELLMFLLFFSIFFFPARRGLA